MVTTWKTERARWGSGGVLREEQGTRETARGSRQNPKSVSLANWTLGAHFDIFEFEDAQIANSKSSKSFGKKTA